MKGEIIFYATPDGTAKVEVLYEGEAFWLSQKRMAELFGVEVPTINYHLKEIFQSEELDEQSVIRSFRITATDGKSYDTKHYALDAIIAVGYRVNSKQATQFRIWATNTLKEFIVKGFVLDDERLKLNKRFGKDYFDELVERIREIRASERRFYLKITDLYEQASIDYDPKTEVTKTFFASVQNKLHWAVIGKTAAEIIAERADADKPSTDWVDRLDAFLKFNEYDVLVNPGKVSAEVAKRLAERQYEVFRVKQDQGFESDFEREVKRIEGKK